MSLDDDQKLLYGVKAEAAAENGDKRSDHYRAFAEEEGARKLVQRMLRTLLMHFQNVNAIPEYGQVGLYRAAQNVSGQAFRGFLLKYTRDNSLGRFIKTSPFLLKSGKMSEAQLMRRLNDLFESVGATVVREEVEELSAEIRMAREVELLCDRLNDEENPVEEARLVETSLTRPHQMTAISEALAAHGTVKAVELVGNSLGDSDSAMQKEVDGQKHTMRFVDIICKSLSTIPNLRSLTMSSNNITNHDMPSIGRLHQLVSLNLSNNNIQDAGASLLGDTLVSFNKLRMLDLSRNEISDEGISALIRGLTRNPTGAMRVEQLRLSHNQFASHGWNALSHAVMDAPNLLMLDVSGNIMPSSKKSQQLLMRALHQRRNFVVFNCTSMRSNRALAPDSKRMNPNSLKEQLDQVYPVDLSLVMFGDSLVTMLDPLLRSTTHLRKLDLSNNLITPNGCMNLCRAIAVTHTLERLNLAWNDIRTKGVSQLAKMIRSGKSNIIDLDVSYNQISDAGVLDLLHCLAKDKPGKPMKRLVLAGNEFPQDNLLVLVKSLNSRKSKLEHLDVSDMGCSRLWRISRAMPRNQSLKTLIMARNFITLSRGMYSEEFASEVLSSKTLTHLDVSFNKLGDDGALAFARYIGNNKVLQHLNIAGCGLSKPSAYGLSRALAHNSILSSLNMSWNEIGAQGATALLDMLDTNHTMKELDAGGYAIPHRFFIYDHNKSEAGAGRERGVGVFHSLQTRKRRRDRRPTVVHHTSAHKPEHLDSILVEDEMKFQRQKSLGDLKHSDDDDDDGASSKFARSKTVPSTDSLGLTDEKMLSGSKSVTFGDGIAPARGDGKTDAGDHVETSIVDGVEVDAETAAAFVEVEDHTLKEIRLEQMAASIDALQNANTGAGNMNAAIGDSDSESDDDWAASSGVNRHSIAAMATEIQQHIHSSIHQEAAAEEAAATKRRIEALRVAKAEQSRKQAAANATSDRANDERELIAQALGVSLK
jgi:Ran GTPase-activating protein (RanGAP) involved in mRNA processing and transport